MKTLYFDIDGTIVSSQGEAAKPRLGAGRLEAAVRKAGVGKLVCVGNFCRVAAVLRDAGLAYDGVGVALELCRGAFADPTWFRSVTTLVAEPEDRASHINFDEDWWYMDDLATIYLRKAGRQQVLEGAQKARVLMPAPDGDGQDVLDWLERVVV